MSSPADLFSRCPANPILGAGQWPYAVNSVFNPGVARLADGSTLLLCRVEDRRGHSHFTAARSRDGVGGWRVDPEPTLRADPEHYPEELYGIEDPRITYLEELAAYGVAYTAYGRCGPGVALALTEDFRSFDRLGLVLPPDNKDAALLPWRVGGRFLMLHRPMTLEGAHIWLSASPDLRHWGEPRLVLRARRGGWWDAQKIGLCAPPIETPVGWLLLYHGVRQTAAGGLYRVGLALLDLERPWLCVRRGEAWVLGPEAEYERQGDVANVVFPCGAALDPDGDTLRVYYGAADTSVALATASLAQLLAWLEESGSAP